MYVYTCMLINVHALATVVLWYFTIYTYNLFYAVQSFHLMLIMEK